MTPTIGPNTGYTPATSTTPPLLPFGAFTLSTPLRLRPRDQLRPWLVFGRPLPQLQPLSLPLRHLLFLYRGNVTIEASVPLPAVAFQMLPAHVTTLRRYRCTLMTPTIGPDAGYAPAALASSPLLPLSAFTLSTQVRLRPRDQLRPWLVFGRPLPQLRPLSPPLRHLFNGGMSASKRPCLFQQLRFTCRQHMSPPSEGTAAH